MPPPSRAMPDPAPERAAAAVCTTTTRTSPPDPPIGKASPPATAVQSPETPLSTRRSGVNV